MCTCTKALSCCLFIFQFIKAGEWQIRISQTSGKASLAIITSGITAFDGGEVGGFIHGNNCLVG